MLRFVTCCLALAASLSAQPSLLRLVAVADASTSADTPAANLGAASLVTCGKDFANTPFRVWMTRGHFAFDLAPLAGRPAPARVRLRVWQAQSNAAGCLDVTLHRVTAAWNESTITWQNQPTHDPAAQARACVGDSFDPGWKAFDVTSLVHDWLNGTHPNFGLVIRDPTEQTAGAARPLHAASREGGAPAQQPHLEVGYDTRPFGAGCGPSAVPPALDLYDGAPALGGTYALQATGFTSGTLLVHLLGLSDSSWNGLTLPFNLAFLGYPACNVLAAGDLTIPGLADRNGRAMLSFAVPNQPRLVGLRLFHQYFGVDQNLVLAATNGFVARVF